MRTRAGAAGHRDGDPLLSRQRLRLAGQLCRRPLARRRPCRSVRLADAGEHATRPASPTPTPRRSPAGSTAKRSSPNSRAQAGRCSCAAGRRRTTSDIPLERARRARRAAAMARRRSTSIVVTGCRMRQPPDMVSTASPPVMAARRRISATSSSTAFRSRSPSPPTARSRSPFSSSRTSQVAARLSQPARCRLDADGRCPAGGC